MGVTSGAGTANHSREPNVAQFLSSGPPVAQSLVFFIVCRSLQFLITPLVNYLIHGNTLWIRKYKLVILGQKVDQIYTRYTYKYSTVVDKSIK